MDIEKQRTALDNLPLDLEEAIDLRLSELNDMDRVTSKEAVAIIMDELGKILELLDRSYAIGLLTIFEFDRHRAEITVTARRKLGLE